MKFTYNKTQIIKICEPILLNKLYQCHNCLYFQIFSLHSLINQLSCLVPDFYLSPLLFHFWNQALDIFQDLTLGVLCYDLMLTRQVMQFLQNIPKPCGPGVPVTVLYNEWSLKAPHNTFIKLCCFDLPIHYTRTCHKQVWLYVIILATSLIMRKYCNKNS